MPGQRMKVLPTASSRMSEAFRSGEVFEPRAGAEVVGGEDDASDGGAVLCGLDAGELGEGFEFVDETGFVDLNLHVASGNSRTSSRRSLTSCRGLVEFDPRLVFAFDQVGGQGFERCSGLAERSKRFECVGYEFVGVLEGLVDAVDGGPGGLDAGGVLAGGLA